MAPVKSIILALAMAASVGAERRASKEFFSKARGRAVTGSVDDDIVDPSMCDGDVVSRAGYFDLVGSQYDDGSKNYFFWMFESHNNPATDPVVLWLTGGPGCASSLALLTENGPCKVNDEGTGTVANPLGWNQNATVIWLDQPAGVGYSYGKENDSNEDMVGEDAYFFLQSLFAAHPQYAGLPFYVFGESFGGHYAPGVAHAIYTLNAEAQAANKASIEAGQAADDSIIDIPLAGLGVGNGLTDPLTQYAYYPEMAMNNSYGIKTVSESDYEGMVANMPKCLSLTEQCQTNPAACKPAQIYCSVAEVSPYAAQGLNVYDIRIPCEVEGLCYDFSNVETFMQLPSTLEALHIRTDLSPVWTECNYDVNGDFASDFMKGYQSYVSDLLDAGVPTLIYTGDADYVCNWYGNKAWTLALDWSGASAFNAATDVAWSSGSLGGPGGEARSANGFTFLRVFEAGHLVPMDQPGSALSMINTFISGGSFA